MNGDFLKVGFRRLASALLIVIVTNFAGCSRRNEQPAQGPPEIIVAAAADLTPAFEELGKLYEKENNTKVTFSFGSTGNLTEQIENGAPFDLFAAASVSYIDRLESKGLILPGSRALYATGRL